VAPAPVRIALVEDHPIYRHAVEQLIGSDRAFEVVASFGGGIAFLDAVEDLQADVVLVDLHLPDLEGLTMLRRATRARPDLRCVVLTGDTNGDTPYAALEAGAVGYLLKDIDPPALLDALGRAARGEVVLQSQPQLGIVRGIQARAAQTGPTLTERERQVLALMAEGLSALEAAQQMHLSTGTVKAHLGSIYEKLDAPDRAAAVARAMRLGILT